MGANRKYGDDVRDDIVALYESGSSSRSIAREKGVGVSFVLAVVRGEGIVRRPGRTVSAR